MSEAPFFSFRKELMRHLQLSKGKVFCHSINWGKLYKTKLALYYKKQIESIDYHYLRDITHQG